MNRLSRRALACALLTSTSLCAIATPAQAQTATNSTFPVRQFVDDNGVDLFAGLMTASTPQVVIGDGENGLSFVQQFRGTQATGTFLGQITFSGSTYTVGMNGESEVFIKQSNGTFLPQEQRGSTLTLSGSIYTYRTSSGLIATFSDGGQTYSFGNAQGIALTSVTYPNGKKLTFNLLTAQYVVSGSQGGTINAYGRRLQSVTSNTGYHIHFNYQAPGLGTAAEVPAWTTIATVLALNDLVDSCSPSAAVCGTTAPRPSLTISGGDFTDSLNRTTHFDTDSNGITAVKLPGSSSANISVTYSAGKVASVTKLGVATTYGYVDASGLRTTTVTDARGKSTVYTFDIANSLLKSRKDPLNRTTTYDYDTSNRPTKVTAPEGNYVSYVYDTRGNVTSTTATPKAGSSNSPVTTTASYDSTCTNPVTCNQPNSTSDAYGRLTDYTYDSVHGGILTATAPAAGGTAPYATIRPKTTYSYARFDANGAASATGVVRPTGASACQTTATCAGTADEVKSTIAYGANQNVSSASVGNGTGTLVATTAYAYDAVGNKTAVDGPLTGTDDATAYRYDAARQLVGTVSADPDGQSPSLKPRAVRNHYNSWGQPDQIDVGTVTDQTDTAWTSFAVAQTATTSFDANGRPLTQKVSAGGTDYALTQASYDVLGRAYCVALRMNTAAYGSLPANACTLGTQGSYGPDRISQTEWDDAGQVVTTRTAANTAQEQSVTRSYTNNGKLLAIFDGESNKTSYAYDGLDRLVKTYFPVSTKGASNGNADDFEQLTYDNNGNITQRLTRSGGLIVYSYDALNRRTHMGSSALADVDYTYDVLGRPLTAIFSTSQQGITNAYDALSRVVSSNNSFGSNHTLSYAYDLAGRRTRMTWWDNNYFDYDRLVTGELSKVRANGATSGAGVLATFAYDDLGQRTLLTRGNGTTTSYAFNAVSQLTTLAQDLGGTSSDLTIGGSTTPMSYNPAGQIVSQTRSNDAYAWTGHYNVTKPYTSNGLNQYIAVGSPSPTYVYDTNGNLTGDGTSSFVYDIENKLTSVTSNGTTKSLQYDPLGRLAIYNPGSSKQFIYDGAEVVAQLDSAGNITSRYIRGDGADEVLAEYVGSGTATSAVRYQHHDERGSVVATSDSAGNMSAINTYDEYGIPGTTNVGLFQYTGQMWLPEIKLYNYKARMYSPKLGRFMQADPIGYGDGMNMYDYAGDDPIDGSDPSGMKKPHKGWRSIDRGSWSCYGNCGGGYANDAMNGSWTLTPGLNSVPGLDDQGNPTLIVSPPKWTFTPYPGQQFDFSGSAFNFSSVSTNLESGEHPQSDRSSADYCGSSASGTSGVPDAPFGQSIVQACKTHDACYASANNRYRCDLGLMVDSFNECRRGGGSDRVCATIGTIYFLGVRVGGWFSYTGTGQAR